MFEKLDRLRRLAGLREAEEIISPDDADDARLRDMDERDALDRKIEHMIALAFVRLGLDVQYEFERSGKVYTGVSFDSDQSEAAVILDDSEVRLSALMGLMQSGLASDFAIGENGGLVEVRFTVAPEIASGKATLG